MQRTRKERILLHTVYDVRVASEGECDVCGVTIPDEHVATVTARHYVRRAPETRLFQLKVHIVHVCYHEIIHVSIEKIIIAGTRTQGLWPKKIILDE